MAAVSHSLTRVIQLRLRGIQLPIITLPIPLIPPIVPQSNPHPIVPILPCSHPPPVTPAPFGGSKPNCLGNKKGYHAQKITHDISTRHPVVPVRVQYRVHNPAVHHFSPADVMLVYIGVILPPVASFPGGGALTMPSFPTLFVLT